MFVRKFLLRVYTMCRVVTRGLGSDNLCSESKTVCDVYVLMVCFFFLLYCVLVFEYNTYMYILTSFITCVDTLTVVFP
jgi:hypothetical protein